jgi:hypothetical protein
MIHARAEDLKVQLTQWYTEEGKTDLEIADLLGITGVAVSQKRRQYGIPTLTAEDRRVRAGKPPLGEATADDFRRFLAEGKTPRDMAAHYGVSTFPINQRMRKWGLKALTNSDTLGTLPADLRNVVVGTLLGDATIGYQSGGTTSRISMGHSHKQYGYLKRLHARFGPWATSIRKSETRNLETEA